MKVFFYRYRKQKRTPEYRAKSRRTFAMLLCIAMLFQVGDMALSASAEYTNKYLNNPKFTPASGLSTFGYDVWPYSMSLAVQPGLETDALKKALKDSLPKSIYVTGWGLNESFNDAVFTYDPSNLNGSTGGRLKIDWNADEVLQTADSIEYGTMYEFTATYKPDPNGSYNWIVNHPFPSAPDERIYEIPLKVTVTVSSHLVQGLNPAATTVNLFDYWVEERGEHPTNGDLLLSDHLHKRDPGQQPEGSVLQCSSENIWYQGINKAHLLMFGYGGVAHAGLWNKGSGQSTPYGKAYAGMERIVKSKLVNGYPVINLERAKKVLAVDKDAHSLTELEKKLIRDETKIGDYKLAGEYTAGEILDLSTVHDYAGENIQNLSRTLINLWERDTGKSVDDPTAAESLDYLFDPTVQNDYKKSYENSSGLFTLDDEGYYSYNMRKNFAEFVGSENGGQNHFILYDAPATVRTDGTNSIGNFLPFNTANQVFSGEDANGKLISSVSCSDGRINHYLGMTIETTFRQPTNGTVNIGSRRNVPMTFEFSGDDDVWIFIDDVLVLDLGGSHSELFGTIDFSTGEICVGRGFDTHGIPETPEELEANLAYRTSLKEMFLSADAADTVRWKGNTFASNTSHTLKMFYLERGNYDSSLAIRFNLQPELYQRVKKVDQDGVPLEGVEFALYDAEKAEGAADPDAPLYCTNTVSGQAVNIKQPDASAKPIAAITSGSDGIASFIDADGNAFDFSDRYNAATDEGHYYILRETKPLPGYRTLPVDIVLEFNPDTTMFVVANRWATGSYASFTSYITGLGNITYGRYVDADGDPDGQKGFVVPTGTKLSQSSREHGLMIAVPLQLNHQTQKWLPIYGDNVQGFHAVTDEITNAASMRKALLKAALYQVQYEHDWYLKWNEKTGQLEGTLSDMPGRADRYRHINPDGDMRLLYFIIEPEVFSPSSAIGSISGGSSTSEQNYKAIQAYIGHCIASIGRNPSAEEIEQAIDAAVEAIYNDMAGDSYGTRSISMMDAGQFNQDFRSLIYIPNEQRQLRVQKVDQDGKPINGAVFGLYRDRACTNLIASGVTANVGGQNGVLIFQPRVPVLNGQAAQGYAEVAWVSDPYEDNDYYLKEISAPGAGYEINETVVPIVVGVYSIYADAGSEDDGVTVMAGVGRLAQTMTKFAMESDVEITLRDITATAQAQASGRFKLDGWTDLTLAGSTAARQMNLHYGKNAVINYGLHDQDGGLFYLPFFVVKTGFVRARVEQNWDALNQNLYGDTNNAVNKDNLEGLDITCLFSLLNTVVVTNQTDPDTVTGKLAIKKMIKDSSSVSDYTQNFRFTVKLTGPDGAELDDSFYFYGTNKSGYIESGKTIPLHHDEEIVILGLPAGTRFTVTEIQENGWYTLSLSGTIEGAIEDDQLSKAYFVNSRRQPTGELTVSKTVAQGDTNKPFRFTVVLDDAAINGTYGDMTFTDGTASFSLKHGESKTARALPQGIAYTVIEAPDSDYDCTPGTGVITGVIADTPQTAAFINTKKELPTEPKDRITVRKRWTLDHGGTATDSVTVALYRDGQEYERLTLSAANSWTCTWDNLDKGHLWTVEELNIPAGFTASVTKQGNIFIITNKDEPMKPTDSSSSPSQPPQTGAVRWPVWPFFAAVVMTLALVVWKIRKKRSNR